MVLYEESPLIWNVSSLFKLFSLPAVYETSERKNFFTISFLTIR